MKRKIMECKIVTSPRLRISGGWLIGEDKYIWFCIEPLRRFVDMPEAKYYWLQACTRQWKDGSGIRVKVTHFPGAVCPLYSSDGYGNVFGKGELSVSTRMLLRRLGLRQDGKSKTIYFRLLYEE